MDVYEAKLFRGIVKVTLQSKSTRRDAKNSVLEKNWVHPGHLQILP